MRIAAGAAHAASQRGAISLAARRAPAGCGRRRAAPARCGRSPRRRPAASPVARSMTQLCSGQVTASPCTMPWLSGPPRCGQRSIRRRSRRRRCGTRRCRRAACCTHARAAPRDVVERADSTQSSVRARFIRRLTPSRVGQRRGIRARRAPAARSAQGSFCDEALREQEALEAARARFVGVLDDLRADRIDADPRHPFVDALEIAALLAIELDEGDDHLQRLVLGGDAWSRMLGAA